MPGNIENLRKGKKEKTVKVDLDLTISELDVLLEALRNDKEIAYIEEHEIKSMFGGIKRSLFTELLKLKEKEDSGGKSED